MCIVTEQHLFFLRFRFSDIYFVYHDFFSQDASPVQNETYGNIFELLIYFDTFPG